MKTGKELKLTSFKNYNIAYGSVNNKNPKALYINISAWGEPKIDDNINYSRIIRNIDKRVRQHVYGILCDNISTPFLKDRTIVDFDIRQSGVRYGKRSFLSCEITLYMKYEIPANSDMLKPDVYELINTIIKHVLETDRSFKFHKKKK